MRYRLSETVNPELDATASLFDPSLELADAKTILEDLDYASYKEQSHASELLEAVKSALAELLPDVPDASAIKLYGPAMPGTRKQKTGVQVVTPYGEVPLGALSLGYQTMTAWAVDLAWRLYQHYPEVTDPLKQPAIVLIDELDLHLHPRWQRQIRSHISAAFPQVQFIATAHSPLLAQTYLDTNLAVVRQEDGQAVIQNDPEVIRTWRLDEVVTSGLYEINRPFSPEIEGALAERTMLLQKRALSDPERARLAELESIAEAVSGEPRPEDAEAMNVIRHAAQLLKSRSG
jgi:predicted ATP-dependent endonuclease of OLD family